MNPCSTSFLMIAPGFWLWLKALHPFCPRCLQLSCARAFLLHKNDARHHMSHVRGLASFVPATSRRSQSPSPPSPFSHPTFKKHHLQVYTLICIALPCHRHHHHLYAVDGPRGRRGGLLYRGVASKSGGGGRLGSRSLTMAIARAS